MPTPRLTDPYKDLPILNAWIREADHKLRHVSAGLNGVFIASQIGGGGSGTGSDLFWQDNGGNTLGPVTPFANVALPGFISLNGLPINNTDATGYIPVFVDYTLTNTVAGGVGPPVVGGNEVRGVNATVRNLRLAADEPTQGWDFIGVQGTAVIDSGTTVNIIGKQIGLRGEVYAQNLVGAKTHSFLFGVQASISQVGTNNTITNAAGVIIGQPASQGSGGTVTNLHGLWIQNQAAGGLTVTNAYGIRIDGQDGYGRIKWPSLEIASQSTLSSYILAYDTGTTAFKGFTIDCLTCTINTSGTSRVQVNSTGIVPAASATYDCGGSALRWNKFWGVDQNLSGAATVTGNISGGAYYIGATQIVTGSRDIGNIVNITATGIITTSSNISATGSITATGVMSSGSNISATGSVSAGTSISAGTDISASGHIGCSGYMDATTFKLGGTTIVDGSQNLTLTGAASISGAVTCGSVSTGNVGATSIFNSGNYLSISGNITTGATVSGAVVSAGNGANFGPAAVASITVVNGIITAIS